jgi:diketogulonate reductase-like aldo/keto reductase
MNCKRLGDTDIRLPEIGLGTYGYTGGSEPLRAAIDLGAWVIDTAEEYGTEEGIGQALRGMRDRVFLMSKVSHSHFKRAEVLRAAEGSLERLHTDRIDLYQLHRPNYTVAIDETMAAMEELVDQGKVRFIGVSNFSVGQMKRAQAALTRHRLVSNQVRYSLVDRSIETGLLAYCQRNQITVIAYSPLGRGLHHIAERDPGRILDRVAARAGKTPAQVALNWCTVRDGVIAIPKANSMDHIRDNCGASGWRLSPELARLLDAGISFRRRGRVEAGLRRLVRRGLQRLGR